MVPSTNPFIIVVHILACILFLLAASGLTTGVRTREAGEVRVKIWHLGWLGLALLALALILMDFKAV